MKPKKHMNAGGSPYRQAVWAEAFEAGQMDTRHMKDPDPKHWLNRPWILVEEDEELSIWTDSEARGPVLVICQGPPMPEERRLGVHIIMLHNAEYKRRFPDVTKPRM